MYYILNVGDTIFLGIGILFLTGFGLYYLCMNIADYIDEKRVANRQKRIKKDLKDCQEKAIEIIDKFEELLNLRGIKINNNREENDNEACIYGCDYYDLEEAIIEILNK